MKPTTITQAKTLKLVRKPLPPRGKIILDAKTKARRKRMRVELTPDWTTTL